MSQLLFLVTAALRGDSPVMVDFAVFADRCGSTEDAVRLKLNWLTERQYLVLDGQVDGVARVWVNPSVAFGDGTDPCTAAARHRFPFIAVHPDGMAAKDPVHHVPYDEQDWATICRIHQDRFAADPPRFPTTCPEHGPSGAAGDASAQ